MGIDEMEADEIGSRRSGTTPSKSMCESKENVSNLWENMFLYFHIWNNPYEPRCEKTGLRGFRPGPTLTEDG